MSKILIQIFIKYTIKLLYYKLSYYNVNSSIYYNIISFTKNYNINI